MTVLDEARVYTALRDAVPRVVPDIDPAEVAPGRSLADLGASSVDRAEILSMVLADLGISVPVSEFRQGADIRALVELLRRYG